MRRASLAAVILGALAGEAGAAEPDLAVRSLPTARPTPSLRIRKPAPRRVAQASAPPAAGGAVVPASDASVVEVPRSLEERVIFRVAGGIALDSSPTSGDAMRNGVTPGDLPGDVATGAQPLRTANSYLLGDAVLGSRGVPVSALNTYFSSQFRLGLEGVSSYATRNDVWDSQNDNDLLVYSAYAEIDDWGKEGDALHPLFVRAGRQFHYGSALFATQFDGVQLAWEQADWEVGGFAGRRVALYLGDEPGIVAGASARVRLERMTGLPLALALDALSFEGDSLFVEAAARYLVGDARLSLSARAHDDAEDGFGLGRLSARARVPWGAKLLLHADADYVLAHEVAYDYLSPAPVDVIELGSSGIALALPEPGNTLRVGGGVLYTLATGLEAYGFGRVNVAEAVGFDSDWFELGAALEAQLRSGFQAGVQLKLRAHALDEGASGGGDEFADMTGSGVRGFSEASAELRYRPGYHTYGMSAGGWLRSYDIVGPYAEVVGDSRAGGRIDADYWIEKHARVRFIGELAQPSTTFALDLGTQYSVRFMGEASF